jgi:hypothetical protein
MRRDDCDEIGAASDIGADLSSPIADIRSPIDGYVGVAEIQFCGVLIGLSLGDVGLSDGDLRVQNRKLLF